MGPIPRKCPAVEIYRTVVLVVALCALPACAGKEPSQEGDYQVYAVEYAHSPDFGKSSLVRGASRDQSTAFSWFAWVVRGRGRLVLVDTGYDEPAAADGFGVVRFRPVPELLGGLNVEPEQVTDVVVTHMHFDHAGYGEPYVSAKFWIQRADIDWARRLVGDGTPRRAGVRLPDVRFFDSLSDAGRLNEVDGKASIVEGIVLHGGGGHTRGIQWVEIRCGPPTGTIVLASDNAYLYENLTARQPTGSTRDAKGDRLLLDTLLHTASSERLVVPGHDPAVMERFPAVAPGIVRIK